MILPIFRPILTQINNNIINRLFYLSFIKKPCNNYAFYTGLSQKYVKQSINCVCVPVRFYAKGKNKKKDKGKKKIEINESLLADIFNVETLKSQMKRAVDNLKDEYIKNLSLRSTTGAIESLEIDFEGNQYSLQELAQIVRKNPNTIILNLSTFPQAIPTVLKTLAKSGMNLNPQQDGTTVFIPIPKVTKEHRENLAKNAKTLFVKCKENIRETQIKFDKSVKKQEKLGEDLLHQVQEQIKEIGDKYVEEAEKILVLKQNELLGKE